MIRRDVEGAGGREYDVVVIGGGIHGACALLEAARRGLRGHLIERDDFGGATSWNSLRILHGGLRYLQTLDLGRFRESVNERAWFCRHFPDLVRPLACLMPLYDRGLKRRSVLRVALRLNDWMSHGRNRGVTPEVALPDGRVLSVSETTSLFPLVDRAGLRGGAVWHDATMTSPQRVLIEIIRWACAGSGGASNYVAATGLEVRDGRVAGVVARDRVSGRTIHLRTRAVVNCAGPWSRSLATAFDRDVPDLFKASLAFNVLLDRRPVSSAALAVEPPGPDGQVYFLHPRGEHILAGTAHVPWSGDVADPQPSGENVRAFLDGMNRAIPGLDLHDDDVVRVYAGLLPAVEASSAILTKRPLVHDHGRGQGRRAGPRGLVSVCGIKYTTARAVAARALGVADSAWAARGDRAETARPMIETPLDPSDPAALLDGDAATALEALTRMVREESVVTWDDLLLRRTDWGQDASSLPSLRRRVAEILGDEPLLDTIDSAPSQRTERIPAPRSRSGVVR